MSRRGDDGHEMPQQPFDDGVIDAILAGTARDGDLGALSSFVEDVRSTAGAVPTPSAALAAALASGISPTAIPAPTPRVRKWRMKVQGFIAGLSVAGKIALGVGVAAAATTGAGAAGVLPGGVQHAFAKAVETVTPFNVPDSAGEHGSNIAAGSDESTTTSTTIGNDTPTTVRHGDDGIDNGDGDGNGIVTPTTEVTSHDGDGQGDNHDGNDTPTTGQPTPTTEHHDGDNGGGDNGGGDGDHHGDGETTTVPTPPTTEHHDDNNNPQSLSLNCERNREPNHITCTWSAASDPNHHNYVLLRGDGHVIDSTADGLSFDDTNVSTGVQYSYIVDSLDANGHVLAHSNRVYISCCGD